MIQSTLDFSSRHVAPASPTLPPQERQRLSNQNARILARLQVGPATNRELSEIALNYRARISELRDAGYKVECFDLNRETGSAKYKLD